MPQHDIVYILREDIDPEELRYSLRSLDNFPHRLVWFVGGKPEGITPDRQIVHKQQGPTKWDLIKSSMLRVTKEEELSASFFLFNDDFFIMKPFTGTWINYIDGTLADRVEQFRKENPWLNPYARTLFKAEQELKSLGASTFNFDVHLPMLFEKDKIGTIMRCSSPQMRSVYGNLTGCEHRQHKDVKVYDMDKVPKCPDFLSTNDNTFKNGKVGEFIRATFAKPSRFEQ